MIGLPTGIIKCLPDAWIKHTGGLDYIRAIKEKDGVPCWHMSFPTRPQVEVLHLYVLFSGHVQFRVNIMEFKSGLGKMNLYGGSFLAKWWAVCTGPMVFPNPPILMRGFRGFRYTEALW